MYHVDLEFEEDLCQWGNNMVVNFAPLNADWGLAHLVINSVCFAFSVILTMYVTRLPITSSCMHRGTSISALL